MHFFFISSLCFTVSLLPSHSALALLPRELLVLKHSSQVLLLGGQPSEGSHHLL